MYTCWCRTLLTNFGSFCTFFWFYLARKCPLSRSRHHASVVFPDSSVVVILKFRNISVLVFHCSLRPRGMSNKRERILFHGRRDSHAHFYDVSSRKNAVADVENVNAAQVGPSRRNKIESTTRRGGRTSGPISETVELEINRFCHWLRQLLA